MMTPTRKPVPATSEHLFGMIDIGVNLTHKSFATDLADVLRRAWDAGVSTMLLTGTDLTLSAQAAELCRQCAGLWPGKLYATAGVHPHHAGEVVTRSDWLDELRALHQLHADRIRAVGETGLDFNRNFSTRQDQITCFEAQIALATELRQPLFVHDRDSDGLTGDLLNNQQRELVAADSQVVVHCFTGTASELDTHLSADRYIGITGWVADERRGQDLAALVPRIPDDRLLIETDAPYLMPRNHPDHRRQRRNEPANLIWVARRIAELRGVSLSDLQTQTAENARRLFRLSD